MNVNDDSDDQLRPAMQRLLNAETTRLRAELSILGCRVVLLSEEDEQLRRAADTAPVVGLPSCGKGGP